jgi:tetratricopeptide (TPR) repeat protein
MDEEHVEHVNLAYFGTADPQYYGINATLLPGTPVFDGMTIGKPILPGYVAISVNMLSGQYLLPEWRLYYREFRERKPAVVLGHTIRVYWVDRWPEPEEERRASDDVEDVRALARGLARLGSLRHAALHYREIVNQRPTDARALARLGAVLVQDGQFDEGLRALRTALDLAPGDASIRYDHGIALLIAGSLARAEIGAEAWVRLTPSDPRARHLLGLVRRTQGRLDEARIEMARALESDPSFTPARDALASFGAGAPGS